MGVKDPCREAALKGGKRNGKNPFARNERRARFLPEPWRGYRLKSCRGLPLVALPTFSPPRMNNPVLHATVYFSGHVQGVGFRYATLQVAKEFEVAGYVSNLSDGRVLLEAEGQPGTVDQFVAAVE